MEEVFTMVDELTKRVRDGLRITLKDLVEFDKDLADATTNSIEAYRYFAEGVRQFDMVFFENAVENFEESGRDRFHLCHGLFPVVPGLLGGGQEH